MSADFMVDVVHRGDAPFAWAGYPHAAAVIQQTDTLSRALAGTGLYGVELLDGSDTASREDGRAASFCICEGLCFFVHAKHRTDLDTYLGTLELDAYGYTTIAVGADQVQQ